MTTKERKREEIFNHELHEIHGKGEEIFTTDNTKYTENGELFMFVYFAHFVVKKICHEDRSAVIAFLMLKNVKNASGLYCSFLR